MGKRAGFVPQNTTEETAHQGRKLDVSTVTGTTHQEPRRVMEYCPLERIEETLSNATTEHPQVQGTNGSSDQRHCNPRSRQVAHTGTGREQIPNPGLTPRMGLLPIHNLNRGSETSQPPIYQ